VNDYVFRMPEGTPDLTYKGLDAYLGATRTKGVGATVRLLRYDDPDEGALIMIRLYATTIAVLYADGRVHFTREGAQDQHLTTGQWLNKVAHDNNLGYLFRDNWVRYLYPRRHDIDVGRARVPVAGQTFTHPDYGHARVTSEMERHG
jgi:hypothetical protein